MQISLLSRRLIQSYAVLFVLCASLTWAQTKATSTVATTQCNLNAQQIQRIATRAKYQLIAPIRQLEAAQDLSHSSAEPNTAYVACKPWGLAPGKLVALVVMPSPKVDYAGFDLDMLVIVAESDLRNPVVLMLEDFVGSDAIKFSGIGLDTAAYKLGADKLGFGVWQTLSGSSGPNPYEARKLSFFVLSNNALKRVMDNIDSEVNQGEWDMNCTGEFQRTKRTIQVADQSSNGLANLLVKQTRNKKTVRPAKASKDSGDCNETLIKLPLKMFSLKFNGDQYILSKDMD